MSCNYGKYPFCRDCKFTGEKCEDYYAKELYEEKKAKKEMLEQNGI